MDETAPARAPRSWLAPLLGSAGWLSAGPLAATLLVGRTGPVPSLRWAGICLATWIAAGAIGWATAQGRLRFAAIGLAPTAAVALFLPWAYYSDPAFHALTGSAWTALGALAALALLGPSWQAVRPNRQRMGESEQRTAARTSPALLAPLMGMALLFGANDVLFEPLGRAGPVGALSAVAGILPALVLALVLHRGLLTVTDASALAGVASLCGGLTTGLGLAPPGPWLFAAGALSLAVVVTPDTWQPLPRGARTVLALTLTLGLALAGVDGVKLGLGARELLSVVPAGSTLLPALGPLLVAAAVAAHGALSRGGYASRSAAIGGMRDA